MKELPPDVHAALVKRLGRFILDGALRRAAERERAIAAAPAENDAPPAGVPAAVASPARRRAT